MSGRDFYRSERFFQIANVLRSHILLLIFAILIILFSMLSEHFSSTNNLLLLLMRTAPLGIVVVGQTIVIITGGIDLSVGSVAGFTSIVAAKLMLEDGNIRLPPLMAIFVALLVAAAIGGVHGWLITRRELSPFIVTLSSMSLIKGLALVYSNAAPIPVPHGLFSWMWSIGKAPRPIPIFLMFAVFALLWYSLRNTKLGRYAFAIGSNETVARMSGVNVDRYKIQVYVLSSFLAGLSGLLLMTRLETGAYTNGENFALVSIAAVVIGGASLRGGSGSAWGSLLGVLLLTMVDTGLGLLNVSSLWSSAVIGGLILIAALADVERRKAREAVTAVRVEQPTSGSTYIAQLLGNLRLVVKQRLACDNIRLYIVDRETGDIIELGIAPDDRTIINHPKHLAKQVEHKRSPIYINAIDQEETMVIKPIKPELQSAIAVPITHADRVIAILELQSPYNSVFNMTTAARLSELVQQFAPSLEDAWLLDSGWFLRHTREAFRHLWEEAYLGKCSLANWIYASDNTSDLHPAVRGRQVQQMLLSAIEMVREKESGDRTRARRHYQVLYLTYVEGLSVEEITEKLSISRRQYFYDLKNALEVAVHLIINREAVTAEADPASR